MNSLEIELYQLVKSDFDIYKFIETNCLNGLLFIDNQDIKNNYLNPKFLNTVGYNTHNNEVNNTELNYIVKTIFDSTTTQSNVTINHFLGYKIVLTIIPFKSKKLAQKTLVGISETKILNEFLEPKTEAELLNQNFTYSEIIKGTNVCTWVWNVVTGELELNEKWFEILGYTKQELMPISIKTWENIIHPDDLPKAYEAIYSHFEGKTAFYENESRLKHKNGNWVWVLDRGKVSTWTNDGQPLLMYGSHLDITHRKAEHETLVNVKKLLKQSSLIAKIGGWEYDVVNDVMVWSEVTKLIYEVGSEFKPSLDNTAPFFQLNNYKVSIKQLIEESIKKGTNFDQELEIITANGNKIWIRAMGRPEYKEGTCIKVYGTFQNINDLKSTELENKRVSKLIEKLSNELPGGLFQFQKFDNGEMAFPYSSNRFLKLFDLSMENYNFYPHEAFEMILEEDREMVYESIRISGENLEKWNLDFRAKISEDKIIWVRGEASPERLENSILWHGYLQDITAHKKIDLDIKNANDRFALATKSAGIGVWEINLADKSILLDDVMYKLFEASKDDFEKPIDLFNNRIEPEDLAYLKKSVTETYSNHKDLDIVYKITIPNGEQRYLKTNARVQYDANNIATQLIGITYDVTEQKTSEIAIKQAKETAEAASKSKSDFLANMSHEIRTPLNGVIGFIDLLMKTKLDSMQHQYMDTVFKSANTLLEIINDILDFSKIEAGKLELSVEEIDLFELGSQVTDIVKFQAHAKNLEILLKISPRVPQFILADSIRLRQILVNLLGNAIKFTEKGEIELKIEAVGTTVNSETHFRFSVRDTGVGIDSKNLYKIFEAFSQEDASTSRKFGGTGLGLTISNKLLSLMGSKLELKSEIGIGSVFYFDILLKSKSGNNNLDWKKLTDINKVLIVDDNANNRIILQQMFSLRYVQIDTVKNGIEALEKLNENNRYDVILMDYNMPYLDGIETVKNIRYKLKLSDNELPIILLNNSTEDEQLNAICEELSIQHKLVKPVKLNQLYNCLLQVQNKEQKVKLPPTKAKKQEINRDEINILIADDNQINMMLTKSIFKNILPNAIIQEAQNGIEAVSMFVKHKPDIIFMDIQMPEMNGYKAAIEIRKFETEGHVPIVALTAGTVIGEKERCLRAGMDDYISKPVVTETIINTINKWLDYSNGVYKKRENMETNELNKHFDFEKLKERLDQDEELIDQLMLMTKEYLIDFIPTLDNLINKNDKSAIRSHAHKMKGTALSVCFSELALLALELEKMDNFDDYNFVSFKANIVREINYLVNMINERTN